MKIFNDTTYVEKTQEEVKQMYHHYKNGDNGRGLLYTLTEVNYLLKEVIKGCEESNMVRYALEKLYLNLGDIEIDDKITSRSSSIYTLQEYLRVNCNICIDENTIGYLYRKNTKLDAIQVRQLIINSCQYYPILATSLIRILGGNDKLTEEDSVILRKFAYYEDIDYEYFYKDLQNKCGWGD